MILHINNSEYDYHTLVKVAEMAGLAGIVGFHECPLSRWVDTVHSNRSARQRLANSQPI